MPDALHHYRRFPVARALLALVSGTLVFFTAGCSAFGGGEGTVKHATHVSVTAPAGWKETEHGESDHAFRLPSGSVATLVTSCAGKSAADLEMLTKHLLIGTRNVKYKKRETAQIGAHEGLRSSVEAQNEGVPFFLELFVMRKSGCVFDFSLMSRKQIPESELGDFAAFIKSMRHGKN